jgi:hypothetical protein
MIEIKKHHQPLRDFWRDLERKIPLATAIREDPVAGHGQKRRYSLATPQY